MPVEMDQIASYAMIVGFFLLFGIIFLTQVKSYAGEEQALPALSPAAEEVRHELSSKSRLGMVYYALIVGFFMLIGTLTVVVARTDRTDTRKERKA